MTFPKTKPLGLGPYHIKDTAVSTGKWTAVTWKIRVTNRLLVLAFHYVT
jgi:hypothetical protein